MDMSDDYRVSEQFSVDGNQLTSHLYNKARRAADWILLEHPVLSLYKDHISILIVGSLGSGFADDLSDIDLWVICADDAVNSISEQFEQNELRFNEPPPHLFSQDGTEVHYFTFPISKLRCGLEMLDDLTLHFVKNCIVHHDANNQFFNLVDSLADLSADVVKDKITNAYSRIRVYTSSMQDLLKRYQPVVWLQCTSDIIYWSLSLVSWIDGKAPAYPKWIMRQAESCSTSQIIIPVLNEVMRTIGTILDCSQLGNGITQPAIEALSALDLATRQALDVSGYADIPTPELRRI
ncbi:MAG: hypothetical protein ACYC27_04635 [Armatimonadota bacterium]